MNRDLGLAELQKLKALARGSAPKPIKWVKISDYCIKCDEYTITKAGLETPKYKLWHGKEPIKHFDSADEAKKYHAGLV
jgi:hypothetical protein